MKKDPLSSYRTRRNFTKSPEPKGKVAKTKKHIFVIQHHDSSHPHYDVRLEIGGVLKSWAVPKGPSLNPAEKRLAILTDDHPISYSKFEGVIPIGNYGAGTVMVWDYGKYENIKEKDGKIVPMRTCYKDGRIEVFLDGKKIQGAFALLRTKLGDKFQWLLIKMKDQYASRRRNPVNTEKKSALSGKTMREIEKSGKIVKTKCKKS